MTVRGSYAKSAAIRERILSAALRVIAERGFSGASVQHVADEIGMSKAGLLHHFGSRERLFAAVLTRRDEESVARSVTDSQAGASAPTDRVAVLLATVKRNQGIPGLAALYAAFIGEAASSAAPSVARDFARDRYARLVSALGAAIARQPGWDPRRLDPADAARLLVAAADGLQTQWLLDPKVDMSASLLVLWRSLLDHAGAG